MKQTAKRLLQTVPFARELTYKRSPYYTGTPLENRLGAQLVRLAVKHRSRQVAPSSMPISIREPLQEIQAEGICSIPDFLDQKTALAVLEEAARLKEDLEFKPLRGDNEEFLTQGNRRIVDGPIFEALAQNQRLLELARGAVNRPLRERPSCFLDCYQSGAEGQRPNDIEAFFHSDTYYPTIKAWYLLRDLGLENGPFVYARGSHRLTPWRWRHEYRKSVLTARLNRGLEIPAEFLGEAGDARRVILDEEEIALVCNRPIQVTGKAGTLIVANNFGFHRRGTFQPNQRREWVLVNFRDSMS
jgi:hypothetical protein